MNGSLSRRVLALTVSLIAVGACSSGPPAISDLKVGKDKEVTQAASAFEARETLFAVATIDNPPDNGKVIGRLVIVDVPGQQPGPIPGLEATVDLGGAINTANFNFSAPNAGWPDGKYKIDVVLVDASGAEKGTKSAELTTTGNPPAPPVAEAPAAGEGTEAPATTETQPQQ
jgi:hypothetical protein